MSTALDDILVPGVADLINSKVGTDAVFEVPGAQDYDTRTGQVNAGSPTNVTAKVSPPVLRKRWKDGQLVREGGFESVLAGQGLTFTPVTGMKVTIGGESYRIEEANAIRSGDLVCAYILVLKGGT